MRSHLLAVLVIAVTAVLLVLILKSPDSVLVNLTVLIVLTVLVMVVSGAERYLPKVLLTILSIFHRPGR
jgi:hypothetical protein